MGYYDEHQPTHIVDVLGTLYAVYTNVSKRDDKNLERCDGYCDKTVKRCVVSGPDDDNELGDFDVYAKTNLRHELIHAFLFESGLDGNSSCGHGLDDHDEQMVEWIAVQFPKILKVFQKVDAL